MGTKLFNNPIRTYFYALIIFLVFYFSMILIERVIIVKLKKLAKKTKTRIDDIIINVIAKVGWPFYFSVALYFSSLIFVMPPMWSRAISEIMIVIVTVYAILAVQHIMDFYTNDYIKKEDKEEPKSKHISRSHVRALNILGKIVLWSTALLLILENLGYNISALIAGLGIGGIAIAFALQNILTDIFASFSIYFDKPFEEGDYITIGDESGTVKKIGIKTTRLETLQGDELVVSNKELTESKVHNYKKMKKRRVSFNIGVEYDTPVKKLEKIPKIIADIINKIDKAEISRVHFNSFGDSALIFVIVYYIQNSDYVLYMDIQQKINLEIMKVFEKEKISMAFPTQTIYLKK